jgi:hypothetical protein
LNEKPPEAAVGPLFSIVIIVALAKAVVIRMTANRIKTLFTDLLLSACALFSLVHGKS